MKPEGIAEKRTMTRMLRTRDVRPESRQTAEDLSDENLLDQFLSSDQAESEEAFRALVDRHGPMVLGVCRHVLNRHHDAEDVFQATFLVLARKGGLIRNRRVLAGWLHEVAYRMAVKARTGAVRRRAVEREGVAMLPRAIEPGNQDQEAAWNELRPVLHAEVNRLPDRYRLPVILSYLEGKTNEEVAELLEWPLGTVKGRLSRARDLLRSRLLRRGLSLAAAFLVKSLSEDTVFAEVVPVELSQRATRLASLFRSHPGSPSPVSSTTESSIKSNVSRRVDSSADGPYRRGRIPRRLVICVLFSVIFFSTSVGVCQAVFNPGGDLFDLRAVLSALIPGALGGDSTACH
jgi:RNA polymerase sigma factor (sigma-70 family)